MRLARKLGVVRTSKDLLTCLFVGQGWGNVGEVGYSPYGGINALPWQSSGLVAAGEHSGQEAVGDVEYTMQVWSFKGVRKFCLCLVWLRHWHPLLSCSAAPCVFDWPVYAAGARPALSGCASDTSECVVCPEGSLTSGMWCHAVAVPFSALCISTAGGREWVKSSYLCMEGPCKRVPWVCAGARRSRDGDLCAA